MRVLGLSFDERQAPLAHCVALLVDAMDRDDRKAGANVLAQAIDLDMRAYWRPSAENYFSRVPKALILDAVRECVSAEASRRLQSFKKADMAHAAEQLLEATSWLPAVLRTGSTADDEQPAAAE